jgi:1-deoxy-D-xylulose-5-phosphate reductoisomerase
MQYCQDGPADRIGVIPPRFGMPGQLNAVRGAAGPRPTLAAPAAGPTAALASNESIIIGGSLVNAGAKPGQMILVDSEHSAIAQGLRGGCAGDVRRLVLTASGGQLRRHSQQALQRVNSGTQASPPETRVAIALGQAWPTLTLDGALAAGRPARARAGELISARRRQCPRP